MNLLMSQKKKKEEIKSNIVKDLVTFNKHKKAAESQRFKKRWVQSTEISDKIGGNARLSETITSSGWLVGWFTFISWSQIDMYNNHYGWS
jgi:hypothetical protein